MLNVINRGTTPPQKKRCLLHLNAVDEALVLHEVDVRGERDVLDLAPSLPNLRQSRGEKGHSNIDKYNEMY